MAKVPTNELNSAAAQFLGARVLYTVLYMTARNEAYSYLRTGAFAWSVSIPVVLLFNAANRAASVGDKLL